MAHRLLNDFKKYAELAVEDTDKDDKISLALYAAEDLLLTYYSITLNSTSVTKTFDGNGKDKLYTNSIVNTLDSVTIDGTVVPSTNFSVKDNVIRYINNTFPVGYDNIVVVYTVGYADTAIPGTLQLALYKLADKFYTDADEARDGVSGYQTNTKTGIDYVVQQLPTSFELLVAPYRVIHL